MYIKLYSNLAHVCPVPEKHVEPTSSINPHTKGRGVPARNHREKPASLFVLNTQKQKSNRNKTKEADYYVGE